MTHARRSRRSPPPRANTERSVRMTLSLVFLAPDLSKAAAEGKLPRGVGLKRLVDLPMAWPDQWKALGLRAQTAPQRGPLGGPVPIASPAATRPTPQH